MTSAILASSSRRVVSTKAFLVPISTWIPWVLLSVDTRTSSTRRLVIPSSSAQMELYHCFSSPLRRSQSLPRSFLDSFYFVFHSFLNRLCPCLVDIQPGDENMYSGFHIVKTDPHTFSNEIKLLVIDLYLGSHPFLFSFHFGHPEFMPAFISAHISAFVLLDCLHFIQHAFHYLFYVRSMVV